VSSETNDEMDSPSAPSGDSPAESPAESPGDDSPFDEDFDTLGFDTGFGLTPNPVFEGTGGFGASPGGLLSDDDDTPPGGIYAGEEVQVLSASAIGRALAEAEGRTEDYTLPDLGALQKGLVGIDVGAAVAVVARFTDDGGHEIVPNDNDERITPVQIFFDEDGERLVGKEARLMAASAPERAIVDVKEVIANPEFVFSPADGQEMDAGEVLKVLLSRLLEDVTDHAGQAATHIAMAAPAWYGDAQRELLVKAATESGVEVVGITDESLAAAVPFSLRLPDLNQRRALVFDLGHAALGAAIVRCGQGDIEVLAQAARRDLGSAAWDKLLFDEAARKFEQAHGIDPRDDPEAATDLRLRAEDTKRQLSRLPHCTLVISCGGKTLKVGFRRKGFQSAATALVDGALELIREVRDKAEISSWEEIDALIMTGGGSRTPAIRKAIGKETGLEPERGISPEEGVAVGALYWGLGERHRKEA
jgi:molecular chaperone DnaK